MSTTPYEALDVARYVVLKTSDTSSNVLMSNLRLQKVLYFIQLAYLQSHSAPFFADPIEAWKYGPVVPNVYRAFAVFGGRPIRLKPSEGDIALKNINKNDQAFIDNVLQATAKFNINQLVDITHKHKAWIRTYHCFDQTISLTELITQAKSNG